MTRLGPYFSVGKLLWSDLTSGTGGPHQHGSQIQRTGSNIGRVKSSNTLVAQSSDTAARRRRKTGDASRAEGGRRSGSLLLADHGDGHSSGSEGGEEDSVGKDSFLTRAEATILFDERCKDANISLVMRKQLEGRFVKTVLASCQAHTMSLRSLRLGARAMRCIKTILMKADSPVVVLDVADNNLGDDGAFVIGEIAESTDLIDIRLASNDIGASGAERIFSAARRRKTLVSIDMSSPSGTNRNRVGVRGAHGLHDLLADKGTVITTLKLGHCGLDDACASLIAKGILNNNSVLYLSVEGNDINGSGAEELAAALVRTNLVHISVKGNEFGDSGMTALQKALLNIVPSDEHSKPHEETFQERLAQELIDTWISLECHNPLFTLMTEVDMLEIPPLEQRVGEASRLASRNKKVLGGNGGAECGDEGAGTPMERNNSMGKEFGQTAESLPSVTVQGPFEFPHLLGMTHTLRFLDVSSNNLSNDSLKALSTLVLLTRIQSLNISDNDCLSGKHLRLFGQSVGTSRTLRQLNLARTGLRGSSVDILIPLILSQSSRIVSLNLSNNSLRNLGCKTVCKLISGSGASSSTMHSTGPRRSVLRALDLSICGIGDGGAETIADMIATCRTLYSLSLRQNDFSSEAAAIICTAVAGNYVLLDVDLGLCKVEYSDSKVVKNHVQHNLMAKRSHLYDGFAAALDDVRKRVSDVVGVRQEFAEASAQHAAMSAQGGEADHELAELVNGLKLSCGTAEYELKHLLDEKEDIEARLVELEKTARSTRTRCEQGVIESTSKCRKAQSAVERLERSVLDCEKELAELKEHTISQMASLNSELDEFELQVIRKRIKVARVQIEHGQGQLALTQIDRDALMQLASDVIDKAPVLACEFPTYVNVKKYAAAAAAMMEKLEEEEDGAIGKEGDMPHDGDELSSSASSGLSVPPSLTSAGSSPQLGRKRRSLPPPPRGGSGASSIKRAASSSVVRKTGKKSLPSPRRSSASAVAGKAASSPRSSALKTMDDLLRNKDRRMNLGPDSARSPKIESEASAKRRIKRGASQDDMAVAAATAIAALRGTGSELKQTATVAADVTFTVSGPGASTGNSSTCLKSSQSKGKAKASPGKIKRRSSGTKLKVGDGSGKKKRRKSKAISSSASQKRSPSRSK